MKKMKITQVALTTAAIVGTAMVLASPAHAGPFDLSLVSGPAQLGATTANNYGFGFDGTGTVANPNAAYWVGGSFSSNNLNNAPVPILFVFGPNGAVSTYENLAVGPYDDVEDTQVGVLNKTGAALSNFSLSGPAGFLGFESDGISDTSGAGSGGTATGAGAPTNSSDTSSGLYGGPLAYFTEGAPGPVGNFSSDGSATSVFVNFTGGGLANGASTYFSLEMSPSTLSGGGITAGGGTTSVPEPTSIALAASGIFTLFGFGWKRRKRG